jgi:hypothetical protein
MTEEPTEEEVERRALWRSGKMSCTTAKSPFECKPFMDVCRSKGSI